MRAKEGPAVHFVCDCDQLCLCVVFRSLPGLDQALKKRMGRGKRRKRRKKVEDGDYVESKGGQRRNLLFLLPWWGVYAVGASRFGNMSTNPPPLAVQCMQITCFFLRQTTLMQLQMQDDDDFYLVRLFLLEPGDGESGGSGCRVCFAAIG